MAAVPSTEPVGVRLDEALAEIKHSPALAEIERRTLAETWLGVDPAAARGAGAAGPGRSTRGLDALLLDAAMPRLADPSMLGPERLLGLIEELIGTVDASGGSPLDALGAAMLEEELAKYRLLLGLKNALIEA